MAQVASHWGLLDESAESAAECGYCEKSKACSCPKSMGVVLTEAGEVLINRQNSSTAGCSVAIVIGRSSGGLSRPQTERMLKVWDMAVALADGNEEAICLVPMPHHWRFSRADYMTIGEWQEQRLASDRSIAGQTERRAQR